MRCSAAGSEAPPEMLQSLLVRPFLQTQLQPVMQRLTGAAESDLGFWRPADHSMARLILHG
jgi:hypothetical protein